MTQKTLLPDLPDWIPAEAWAEFVKMRKQIKKPLTEYAAKLVVKKLGELARAGHDPQAVLDQSIMNCWQGIFEVKDRPSDPGLGQGMPRLPTRPPFGNRPQLALVDQTQANTDAALALLGFNTRG